MRQSTIQRKPKIPPIHPDEIPRLEKAREFIGQNFHKGVGLMEAAKPSGLSPFHFHRRYTLHFGETPKATKTRLQIEQAKALMPTKGLPDVAKACGFSHQSHFCGRFKAVTGMTPGRWRRQKRADAKWNAALAAVGAEPISAAPDADWPKAADAK